MEERIQPGDDLLWQTIYRTVIHPSELALRGWTYSRVRERVNTAVMMDFLRGTVPMTPTEEGRRQIAMNAALGIVQAQNQNQPQRANNQPQNQPRQNQGPVMGGPR